MLPTASDNGARLAAILPMALASLAKGLGRSSESVLHHSVPLHTDGNADGRIVVPEALPGVTSFVLVVVDGLGSANLSAVKAHAPTLSRLGSRRIETVIPSTTGAALTTLATGQLPGRHGLLGYRIRHPELGLRSTLKEWDGINNVRDWQRCEPLWGVTQSLDAEAVAIGRPAHARGGLTEAILSGAEYIGGQRIGDRFAAASARLRDGTPLLAYVYIDELDKLAHSAGWQSSRWLAQLEALDAAITDFLRALPGNVGVLITADHGVIDVPEHRRFSLDLFPHIADDVIEIGGEPRMRSLYLAANADPSSLARELSRSLANNAWVATREEAIAANWFGSIDAEAADRLGDVLVAAKAQCAFVLSSDSPEARKMIGQHGSLSAEERGVPLILAGALAGTGFAAAVNALGRQRSAVAEDT